MRPRHYSFTPPAAAANTIATLQTLVGAGSLALDGTYGTTGFTWFAYKLTLTSVNNLSARTFTISYVDENGLAQTATTAGPNATTLATNIYAKQVTAITVDGAAAAVSVGHAVVGIGPWKSLPFRSGYQESGVSVGIDTTANVTVQITFANVVELPVIQGTIDAFDHPSLTGITASAYGSFDDRVLAVRLKINSWTAGAIRYDLSVASKG